MKRLILSTALALIAAPALAETKWVDDCEWKKAENSNYWSRVDGGCGGVMSSRDSIARVAPSKANDNGGEDSGPSDNGGDQGDGKPTKPGNGKPTKPGNGKPSKPGNGKPSKPGNGYGDDNHDHSGPPGQNKDDDKPGKGRDKDKGKKGKKGKGRD